MTFSEYINSIKTKRNEAEFFVDKYVSNSFYKAQKIHRFINNLPA